MSDPLLGTDVGRYRIERLLGEGGMGAVYLGVQPAIGSRVAIKVLSAECTRNPELLERFYAEARSVNLIRHENIVSVLDFEQLPDGRPYIVMEFIEGQTLGQVVRSSLATGQHVPIGGIVQVALEMLSALGAAHALGIVHRDLKPDNVLVTAEGHAKVLDFGIAKLAPGLNQHSDRATPPRTRTGALLGTPAYMAPEQISGTGVVDARTDIYAAGVVLFEAITGTQPFAGETLFDLMRAHLEHAPPSPRERRPELPLAFEYVILTALAKDPAQRFQSATAMAQALRQAAAELHGEQWRSLSGRQSSGGRISLEQMRVPTPNVDPARSPTHVATPIPPPPRAGQTTERTPPSRKGLYGAIAAIVVVGSTVGAIVLAGGKKTADQVAASDTSGGAPGSGDAPGTSGAGGAGGAGGAPGTSAGGTPGSGDALGTSGAGGAPGTSGAGGAPGTSGAGGAPGSGDAPSTTAPSTTAPSTTAPSRAHSSTAPSTTAPSTTAPSTTAPLTTAPSTTAPSTAGGAPTIVGGGSAADHGVHIGPGVTVGNNVVIGGNTPTGAPGRVTKPADYNAKKFDAVAYAPKALALARTVFPDAGFVRMDVYRVYPTGFADLTKGDDETTFWFRSPSHSARPAGIPKNEDVEITCYVEISVGPREVTVWARDVGIDANCKWPIRSLPKCSLAGVWAQAKAQGADADTIAKIGFLSDGKWFFDNDGDNYDGLTESFVDKCP